MAQEIERKFLENNRNWSQSIKRTRHIKQGYLAWSWMTISGKYLTISTGDTKVVVELPIEDANEIQINLSDGKQALRVRQSDDEYFLTIKINTGDFGSVVEVETNITQTVFDLLYARAYATIRKIRHEVPFGGHTFEIDEFQDAREGLVVIEIELDHIDQPFQKPDWLGAEVTGNVMYYNQSLALMNMKRI